MYTEMGTRSGLGRLSHEQCSSPLHHTGRRSDLRHPIRAGRRFASLGESVLTYFGAVGIRATLRPLERAVFSKGYSDKKYRNLIQGGTGAFGNAATRIEAFVASGGAFVYGSYPDIDTLFREQATELDAKRRGAILERIQQLMHEKAIFAPIWEIGDLHGVGPRVADPAIGYVAGYPFSAPYEDVKLKLK